MGNCLKLKSKLCAEKSELTHYSKDFRKAYKKGNP